MLKEQKSVKVDLKDRKNDRKRVLVVAENIALAKLLSSNKKKIRDVGMKKLGRWLLARSNDSQESYDDNFMSIWKGLYYAMWFSDKFLVQEELAEKIGGLILNCKKSSMAIPFIKGFFETMMIEWYGIDQIRYDKYLMLVRRFLRHIFKYCKIHDWHPDLTREISDIFKDTILCVERNPPLSLTLHFSEVYLQELAKMGEGNLTAETVEILLRPFITFVAQQTNSTARMTVSENVFHYLINQSDVGIEFQEKVRAWKQSHFPGNSWDDMEKVEISADDAQSDDKLSDSENKNEEALDPRAGRLDVELPPVNFNAQALAKALRNENAANSKCRAALGKVARELEVLSRGIFPRAEKEALKVISSKNLKKANLEKAAKKLDELTSKFVLKKTVGRAARRLANFESRLNKKRRRRNKKKKFDKGCGEKMPSSAKETEVMHTAPNTGINLSANEINETIQATSETSPKPDQKRLRKEGKPETKIIENAPLNDKEHKRKKRISEEQVEGMNATKKLRKNSLTSDWSTSPIRRKRAFSAKVKGGTPLRRESSGNWEVSEITSTPESNSASDVKGATYGSSSTGKKVTIALKKNAAQGVNDYHLAVSRSPQIPYDAAKRPSHGLLKPNLPQGPINPFYKFKKSKLC